MRIRGSAAALLVLLSLAGACSRGEEPPKRVVPADAKRVDPATAGTVSGRVRVDGPIPQNAPLSMAGDPVCVREHKGTATSETYVGEDGGLGNVFVHVKDGLGNYAFDLPSDTVTLDQQQCKYVPHVFGAQVGQQIEFVNSDPTVHTVHALANSNPEFNFSQPIRGQKDRKYFTNQEVMVEFRCKIHPWMSAYAGIVSHPYFAVTKANGQFEIRNLPPGTYTLEAWHEKLGTQTQRVTLAGHDTREVTFTFKAPAATP